MFDNFYSPHQKLTFSSKYIILKVANKSQLDYLEVYVLFLRATKRDLSTENKFISTYRQVMKITPHPNIYFGLVHC